MQTAYSGNRGAEHKVTDRWQREGSRTRSANVCSAESVACALTAALGSCAQRTTTVMEA